MNLLPLAEVKSRVPLSESTLHRAIREGDLRATKLRGRWFVDEKDLVAFVEGGRPKVEPPRKRHRRGVPLIAPSRRSGLRLVREVQR